MLNYLLACLILQPQLGVWYLSSIFGGQLWYVGMCYCVETHFLVSRDSSISLMIKAFIAVNKSTMSHELKSILEEMHWLVGLHPLARFCFNAVSTVMFLYCREKSWGRDTVQAVDGWLYKAFQQQRPEFTSCLLLQVSIDSFNI